MQWDTIRCNTMQYEAVTLLWWWRINTIALWCDENTIYIGTNRNLHEPMRTCAIQYDNAIIAHRIAIYIGTNRNLHEPMRTCAIQYDNAIIAHRIATYWVATDRRRIPVRMYNESIRMYNDEIRTKRNCHELIRRSAMRYDAVRIGFDSQGQCNTNVLNISKHS